MAKKLQLAPLPDVGEAVIVTTKDCDLDFIILEITQSGIVKYTAAIRINGNTPLKIPAGSYRFNYHYSKTTGPATFNSSVKTPSGIFPTNPDNGSGTARQGEPGLTAYRVIV